MLGATCRADFCSLQEDIPSQPLASPFSLFYVLVHLTYRPSLLLRFIPHAHPHAAREEEPNIPQAHLARGPESCGAWHGVPPRGVCCQPPLALLLQNGLGEAQWSWRLLCKRSLAPCSFEE